MADKEDEEYLQLHLHNYRKENGYGFGFFEGDLQEFLEEYMSSNSSCFVLSERHSKEDNHKYAFLFFPNRTPVVVGNPQNSESMIIAQRSG